jgi:hypothetical protein
MAWTYSGDPSSSTRDAVRFLIGDTDTTDQLLQDEEIDYILSLRTNVHLAAAECAGAISAKFSRYASKSVGDLRISYGDRKRQYDELVRQLRRRANLAVAPVCTSISVSDKEGNEEDTDLVKPAIKIGMHDNKYVTSETDTEV